MLAGKSGNLYYGMQGAPLLGTIRVPSIQRKGSQALILGQELHILGKDANLHFWWSEPRSLGDAPEASISRDRECRWGPAAPSWFGDPTPSCLFPGTAGPSLGCTAGKLVTQPLPAATAGPQPVPSGLHICAETQS